MTTRKQPLSGKRILATLLAVLLLVTLIPLDNAALADNFSIMAKNGTLPGGYQFVSDADAVGTQPTLANGQVWADKSIVANSDGTFTITYSALGRSVYTTGTPKQVDVVLVLDISGSMSGTKLTNAKQVAYNAAQRILAANPSNRVAIVTYDTTAANKTFGSGVYWSSTLGTLAANSGANANTIGGVLFSIAVAGTTNCQDGYRKAQIALQNRGSSANEPVVIMMTDGDANEAYTAPDSATTIDGTNYYIMSTVLQAVYLKRLYSDLRIYTIGFSISDSNTTANAVLFPSSARLSGRYGTYSEGFRRIETQTRASASSEWGASSFGAWSYYWANTALTSETAWTTSGNTRTRKLYSNLSQQGSALQTVAWRNELAYHSMPGSGTTTSSTASSLEALYDSILGQVLYTSPLVKNSSTGLENLVVNDSVGNDFTITKVEANISDCTYTTANNNVVWTVTRLPLLPPTQATQVSTTPAKLTVTIALKTPYAAGTYRVTRGSNNRATFTASDENAYYSTKSQTQNFTKDGWIEVSVAQLNNINLTVTKAVSSNVPTPPSQSFEFVLYDSSHTSVIARQSRSGAGNVTLTIPSAQLSFAGNTADKVFWLEETVPSPLPQFWTYDANNARRVTVSLAGTVTIGGAATTSATFTNTYHATGSISVTKDWDNTPESLKQTVSVKLQAWNGSAWVDTGSTAGLNSGNNYSGSFSGLAIDTKYRVVETTALSEFANLPVYSPADVTLTAAAPAASITVKNSITNKGKVILETLWDDNGDKTYRPAQVVLTLTQNGAPVTHYLTAANEDPLNPNRWVMELDKVAMGAYSVAEAAVADYSFNASGSRTDGTLTTHGEQLILTLKNTLTPPVYTVTLTKTWDDAGNAYGGRPASVDFYLNGDTTSPITLTAADAVSGNVWSRTVNVPNFGVYTVDEAEPGNGYVKTITAGSVTLTPALRTGSLSVTNTDDKPYGEITVSKTWSHGANPDTLPDQAELFLWKETPSGPVQVGTVTLTGDASHTFSQLELGAVYSVTETAVPLYTTSISGAVTLTAAHKTDAVSVSNVYGAGVILVTKTWADSLNLDSQKPTRAQISLFEAGVDTPVASAEIVGNNSAVFGGLEIGKSYYIAEDSIPYYTAAISADAAHPVTLTADASVQAVAVTVTNTYNNPRGSITVRKELKGTVDPNRPDFAITLYKDGASTGQTVSLPQGGQWEHTFTDLDLYSSYYVVETVPQGFDYTVAYSRGASDPVALTNGTTGGSITVTNTYIMPTGSLKVTKVVSADDLPGSVAPLVQVEVTLYRSAEGVREPGWSETRLLKQSEGWATTYQSLPLYNPQGKTYVYEIVETPVRDYILTVQGNLVSLTKNGLAEVTVTNTYDLPHGSVTVTKKWLDADGKSTAVETFEVELRLFKDGVDTKQNKLINAGNLWSATWDNLELDAEYTVSEILVTDSECWSLDYAPGSLDLTYNAKRTGNIVITARFITPAPSLSVQLEVVKTEDMVEGYANIDYKLTVTNNGNRALRDVAAQMEYLEKAGGITYLNGGDFAAMDAAPAGEFVIGAMAIGQTKTILYRVRVDHEGVYQNEAVITGYYRTQAVTARQTAQTKVLKGAIGVRMGCDIKLQELLSGYVLFPYTVTVGNNGDLAMTVSSITDTMSPREAEAGLEYQSFSGAVTGFDPAKGFVFEPVVLQPGQSFTFSYVLKATHAREYWNTTVVTAYDYMDRTYTAQASESVSVVPDPKITYSMTLHYHDHESGAPVREATSSSGHGPGMAYSVQAPDISGYKYVGSTGGPLSGYLENNLEITFLYEKAEVKEEIVTPTPPPLVIIDEDTVPPIAPPVELPVTSGTPVSLWLGLLGFALLAAGIVLKRRDEEEKEM